VSLSTLIADTRQAVDDDAANAQAVFSAQGTLVGITEVDIRTGTHTFKVDEPPALGGSAFPSTRFPCGWKATSTSAASSDSTTRSGPVSPRSGLTSP
jgi:hypothetical protein